MVSAHEIEPRAKPWHHEITRYHWLVLILASAGWVFDVYEGQIFNITSQQMLRDIVPGIGEGAMHRLADLALAVFLVGGTIGGIASGVLADRHGHRPVLAWTIVVYSLFSGLTFLTNAWWQVLVLRFLVAVGVGGAWCVAAALVAEVFPKRLRAYASSFFHATSVLGGWLAALVAMLVGTHWRYAYLAGLVPAALAVMIHFSGIRGREPTEAPSEDWQPPRGSLRELLFVAPWSRRAVGGLLMAAVGLGTFWGITVAGQELARTFFIAHGIGPAEAAEQAKFAFGFIQGTGGGLGLLAFGPLCAFLGRKRAFVIAHLAAYAIVPVICYLPATTFQFYCLLPVFGFLTLCIHAGYAVYFPELFPHHLRATGTGFCFNGGRLLAATVLVTSGWIKSRMEFHTALVVLSQLFLLGAVIACLMPETRNADLSK